MMQIQYLDRPIPPIWLIQPHYTIGRSSACDIQLDDDSLLNIHAHLRVDVKHNTLILIQESTGDISVNNKAMFGQTQLQHGDTLTIGAFNLMVTDSTLQADKSSDGWTIISENQDLAEKQFTIIAPAIVGRGSKCDIHIDVGTQLSRRHAKLSVINSELVVEDLNSSNGTFVNGQKIEKASLSHDDEVSFANVRFRVRDPFFDEEEEKTSFLDLSKVNPLHAIPSPQENVGPSAIERQLKMQQQKSIAPTKKISRTRATVKTQKVTPPPASLPKRIQLFALSFIIMVTCIWLFSEF